MGITQTGPYPIEQELQTPYSGPETGITNGLQTLLASLAQGFSIGIYDLNDAAHAGFGASDPHLLGDAADITSVNNSQLSYTTAPNDAVDFILTAFRMDPKATVGTYPTLIQAVQNADPSVASRLTTDWGTGAHIHLQVNPGGSGSPASNNGNLWDAVSNPWGYMFSQLGNSLGIKTSKQMQTWPWILGGILVFWIGIAIVLSNHQEEITNVMAKGAEAAA